MNTIENVYTYKETKNGTGYHTKAPDHDHVILIK
jgi:hypothetical protein